MLSPFILNADKGNSVMGVAQFIGIALVGAFVALAYGPEYLVGAKPMVVSASPIDSLSSLADKPLAVKEKFYKLSIGVAEYCKNAERIRSNRQVMDLITEVILTYKLEDEGYLQPLITGAVEQAGLKKDASLMENKEKVSEVFTTLSEEVKKLIEADLAKSKK